MTLYSAKRFIKEPFYGLSWWESVHGKQKTKDSSKWLGEVRGLRAAEISGSNEPFFKRKPQWKELAKAKLLPIV